MHQAAADWVYQTFHTWRESNKKYNVLEIGSLNINGSTRTILEPYSNIYHGIDLQEGPGVDIVASGANYWAPNTYDVVVTCETFEHTPEWQQIIKQSWINLKPNGIFIATMAGEGRPPHSALDEKPIREWEHYSNIGAWELNQALFMFNFKYVNIYETDLRCYALS